MMCIPRNDKDADRLKSRPLMFILSSNMAANNNTAHNKIRIAIWNWKL
jgi:hypothetical protein